MTFGALIRERLPVLQAAAESRMTETFIIDRPTGTVIDDEGREQTTYDLVYEGPGRIRSYRPYEQSPDTGASTTTMQRTDWHIPAPERMAALVSSGTVTTWAGPVQAGDRARRVTPGKAVKTVRIAGEHDVTDQTAQRLVVDDITGGAFA